MLHQIYRIQNIKLWGIILICTFPLYGRAQAFDQSYQQWKAQQQAHDQRLSSSASAYVQSGSSGQHVEKISLNRADVQQLQQLHGIGLKKAQAIIEYREKHGGFKHINELQNVKGFGIKLFEKNKSRLAL